MKIKYLAHAAFLITSENGTRIVTDPYQTSDGLKHGAIKETADIVTASHDHGDHNNIAAVKGSPQVVKTGGDVKGIKIKAVPTAHDDKNGSQRGKNTIFCFEVDGVNVCHAGDLGHELSADHVKAIGKVDVLMIPVGGFFTIDAAQASRVADSLEALVIVPMHYKTPKLGFDIATVEPFLKLRKNVRRAKGSTLDITTDTLPKVPETVLLDPSL